MQKAGMLTWIGLVAFALCSCIVAFANNPTDDYRDSYENRRVARITATRGDVQIRRAGERNWEEAAPNVPLLEGDRLATGENSYLEIQFNSKNYLRVDEYSLLQIVTLRNEGIALSLPEGAASLRLLDFNRSKEYFEIDAPNTTVAARKEGLYRVDAPRERDEREVLVAVTGGGEARVYTQNSGFAVRNGRQARIFLEGDYAGEFELTAARSFSDDFDRWVADREDKLSRRRYDSAYYDPAIYGAEELYDYGEWIYTNDYGYVWRPYRTVLASYRDWSPYRYGHWRYLPHYGWTWVADEPWGWATSHYGRWVYINGGWSWCPYDSYRSRRIYWQPSLAIFINFGRRVCWYPMPYYASYKYVDRRKTIIYNTTIVNNTTIINNTNPQIPGAKRVPPAKQEGEYVPPTDVYAKAVTGVGAEEFGKARGIGRPIPFEEAKGIVTAKPVNNGDLTVPPPSKAEFKVEREREVVGKRETLGKAERELETGRAIGAAPREKGIQLDDRLQNERIFTGRNPVEKSDRQLTQDVSPSEKRSTGVFDRNSDGIPVNRSGAREDRGGNGGEDTKGGVERPAPRSPRIPQKSDDGDERPTYRPEKRGDDNQIRPETQKPPGRRNDDDDSNRRPPVYTPPQPKYEPPPRREEPRYEPPPRREEPRYEPPPKREEPQQKPREEARPAPSKREEPQPSAPPQSKKDGRR